MNLENKKILVTGGARRVGKMFVEKLQSFGADVVVHYNTSKNEAFFRTEMKKCKTPGKSFFLSRGKEK